MRNILILLIAAASIMLSGCLKSDADFFIDLFEESIGNSATVTINYESSEKLAPAEYHFTATLFDTSDLNNPEKLNKTEDAIAIHQWSFSDEEYELKKKNQTPEVSHTFNTVGVHYARLDYKTVNGLSGVVVQKLVLDGGSISGTISIALNNLVDVDTRDPSEPNKNNNTFETVQELTSETLLSGIVDRQDPVDFYQVQLQKNQRLMVQMADEDQGDGSGKYDIAELSLYSSNTPPELVTSVKTLADTGRFSGSLIIPNDGVYYLKVAAHNPAIAFLDNKYDHGIYTLSIEAPKVSSNAEFALGEVNVLLKPNRQYMAQGLRTKTDLGRFKTLSLDDARSLMSNAKIAYASTFSLNSMANRTVSQASIEQQRWEVLQAVEILSQHEDVEIAEPNWKRYAFAAPVVNDPDYGDQWHYDTINLPQAWNELGSNRGVGVVAAVIDTGVLIGHPDLSTNIVDGYDYVDNDSDANDTGDKSINGQRSSFHGTHVAGTIAASANSIGGIGVAPNVKIMPVRVLGEGGGYASDIISGVCFAAKLNIADCSKQDNSGRAADVINLSLGGEGFSELENRIYQAVIDKGIIVIAAAGNSGISEPFYPAGYDSVISVSAVSQDLTKASYSNFADPAKGSKIDVAAPGGDFTKDRGIYSTLGDDSSGNTVFTYGSLQGTSMAAPHVAGIAALMKSVKTDLTHTEFVSYLTNGELTHDLGEVGEDNIFGHGLIDAHKAILAIKQTNNNPQLLSSSNQLFFNITQDQQTFVLSTVGVSLDSDVGELSVSVSESSKSWLSVKKESDAGSSSNTVGLGNNTVAVDRSGLDEGSYEGTITITPMNSKLAEIALKVTLQIGNANIDANAGVQYVLVIDKNGEEIAGSTALIANGGQYTYKIIGELPKGEYIVATGSDIDLDNNICDPGESCGQYPTLDRPTVITISEAQPFVKNINMTVGFIDVKGFYAAANEVEADVEAEAEMAQKTPRKTVKAYSRIIREVSTDGSNAQQSDELKKALKTINLDSEGTQ